MKDLFLLHGAIGAKDQLQPLADVLKDKYRIHTFNFSGHGGEPFAKEFSIPHFAEELSKYLQQHDLGMINIFGYSMGGYVAIYFAKQYPNTVDKLVTLATKFYWDETVATKEVKMLNADKIAEKLPGFAEQLKQRHSPNDWKTVLDKTKEMLLQLGKQNALQLADYSAISTPCLLLLGDNDKMVTLDETTAVKEALPNAKFQLLTNTPHPIEQADVNRLASVIDSFID